MKLCLQLQTLCPGLFEHQLHLAAPIHSCWHHAWRCAAQSHIHTSTQTRSRQPLLGETRVLSVSSVLSVFHLHLRCNSVWSRLQTGLPAQPQRRKVSLHERGENPQQKTHLISATEWHVLCTLFNLCAFVRIVFACSNSKWDKHENSESILDVCRWSVDFRARVSSRLPLRPCECLGPQMPLRWSPAGPPSSTLPSASAAALAAARRHLGDALAKRGA